MVYKDYTNKNDRNRKRICNYCKTNLEEKPIVILECNHKEHLECLKNRILFDLYSTFWDNWGIYDHYCLFPSCNGKIKHICECHESSSIHCNLCLGCPHPINIPEKINKLNELCIGKKIIGYKYIGEEKKNGGNIQFTI